MSMYEASAEPWDPAVPDELYANDAGFCPDCDFPLAKDENGCGICGWMETDTEVGAA